MKVVGGWGSGGMGWRCMRIVGVGIGVGVVWW